MKKEVLEEVRNKYKELVIDNDKQKLLVEELEKFNGNKTLSDMIKQEKNKVKKDKDLILDAFKCVINRNNVEDNIYYLLGAFGNSNDNDTYCTNSTDIKYYLYLNLESKDIYQIMYPNEKEEFEKKHTIIKYEDTATLEEAKVKYTIAQEIYFEELFKNNKKEDIIEKVKKIK